MARPAVLLRTPDGALPAFRADFRAYWSCSDGRVPAGVSVPVAPAPRFDDLEVESTPRYRRWFFASLGIHLLLLGFVLAAVGSGIAPRHPVEPVGMIVTLAAAPHAVPELQVRAVEHERGKPPPTSGVAIARLASPEIIPAIKPGAATPAIPPGAVSQSASAATGEQPVAASVATAVAKPPAIPTDSAAQSPAEAAWERSIVARLERHKRYPAAALHAGLSGAVLLRLVLGHDGRLLTAEVVRSEGVAALDRTALAMAASADPFPSPPSSMTGNTFRLLVPVEFIALHR